MADLFSVVVMMVRVAITLVCLMRTGRGGRGMANNFLVERDDGWLRERV